MKQRGLLGYFGLLDWYNSSFNYVEMNLIKQTYKPMGGSYENLIEGNIAVTSVSAIGLLNGVAGCLINKESTIDIGITFLQKAETLINEGSAFSDRHFLYLNFSKTYKRKKDFTKALEYSKKMIDISENVSTEFINKYGKNEISHQGFIDYIDYLKNKQDDSMVSILEEKARREKWRGPWSFAKHPTQ
jgi:hypothetical protein